MGAGGSLPLDAVAAFREDAAALRPEAGRPPGSRASEGGRGRNDVARAAAVVPRSRLVAEPPEGGGGVRERTGSEPRTGGEEKDDAVRASCSCCRGCVGGCGGCGFGGPLGDRRAPERRAGGGRRSEPSSSRMSSDAWLAFETRWFMFPLEFRLALGSLHRRVGGEEAET